MQFDVTFPALQCSIISLDAMDISGQEHLDVVGFCVLSLLLEIFLSKYLVLICSCHKLCINDVCSLAVTNLFRCNVLM
jgi:hypothetical protein